MITRRFAQIAVLTVITAACPVARAMSWTPGWKNLSAASAAATSAVDRAKAQEFSDTIDSAATARAAIVAWEAIAAAQPDDADTWTEIAMLRLLEGAAFRANAKERLVCYRSALQACERAMATNPAFVARVNSGQTTAQAAAALGPREMGAMQFWSTAIFYIFRDCLGFVGRIVNVRLMDDAKTVLMQMDAIDPAWEEYATTFSWGIYYLAMPTSRGGDRVKAREYFNRAVELGAHRLLPRWGRGKYFYAAVRDKAAARADLEAVRARDLNGLGGNRSWNRYFKADAARILDSGE